ncbi:MAG: response regulator [Anaerolineae bacterium]|nr:MAG: response regulator [Anaerolineae bacterium]
MSASILVVEDDLAMRDGVCEILEMAGYRVSVASNGKEALQLLEDTAPELIISDIMMPEMDGYRFYQQVRADDRWLPVPFIFLTAKGKRADVLRGKSMGLDDYLTKTFDPEELLVAVESKLGRMRQLQATAREQMQLLSNQLTRTDRMVTVGQLVTEFAHEIRNPLTAITAYAQFVQRRMARREPETAQDMERIVHQAKRIARMAENILEYSRREPLETRETDIHHLLDEVLAFIAFRLERRGIVVEKQCDSNVPVVLVDPDQLEQVFLNIIINAAHAMETGGTLTVTTAWLDDMEPPTLRISFTDTGVGIAHEHMERLFEPFFTTRPPGQGTGLGLYVCQNVMEKHGGHITVDSQLGKGSTFHVHLPVRAG